MPRRSVASRWAAWERAGSNVVQASPLPRSVTFPTTKLRTIVRIALSPDFTADPSTWAWEDISHYVRYADGIATTNGRRDWTSTADTKTASLRLDNRDGRFSRRNPYGSYYGKLSRNTPIWLAVDAGDGEHTRWQGFVNSWPVRWGNKAATEVSVPISCAGVLRRLSNDRTAVSAMKRTLVALDPLAYWPMEVGTGPDSLGSAVDGGTAMTLLGSLTGSTADPPAGSNSLLDFTGGLSARFFCPASGQTSWSVQFIFRIPATLVTSPVLAQWSTTGDAQLWQVIANPVGSGGLSINYVQSGTGHGASSSIAVDDNEWHHVRVDMESSSFTYEVYLDGSPAIGSGALGLNAGQVTDGTLNPGQATTIGSMGQLAVTAPTTIVSGDYIVGADAMTGFAGEQAHNRISRICDEIGVPFYSLAGQSVPMGPQPISDIVSILRDAEATDQGFLYEAGFGFGYQSNDERTNAPVAMTLDFDLGQVAEPPQPADDDEVTVNRWTSSRSSGSEATVSDTASIAADFAYDGGGSVNVYTDSQLGSDASWHVRMGTVDEDHWPSIMMRLHRSTELIPTWTGLPFGSRINILHPPDNGPPTTIDAFVEGWGERWDSRKWEVVLNTSPASPFDVGKLASTTGDTDPLLGWLEYDTCKLDPNGAGVDTTATSWSVTCTPAETSNADDYPRDHFIGGERITVTASTGGTTPTWTVTRSVNGVVKAHSAGDDIALARPVILTL